MGAKLKSKTHLLNTFFDFLSRFMQIWLQKFAKSAVQLLGVSSSTPFRSGSVPNSANMTQKNFLGKKIKKDIKKRRISR
jgi:hypothetical protein